MEKLNEVIESTKGLNSDYDIGPAYFFRLKNYEEATDPFRELWNYHLHGVLSEYLRGIPDAEAKMKAFRKAYDSGRPTA